jgi:hypothetical protein
MEQDAFDLVVVERIAQHQPVSFEDLQRLLHEPTWNRLFAAADRLSRRGVLIIRRLDRSTYMISLAPPRPPRVL